jgi:hypothetical protein
MRMRQSNALVRIAPALFLLAGCEQKATTHIVSVPVESSPIVEIEPDARDLLAQVAGDQKFGSEWWVRLEVVWRKEAQIDVTVEKQPPGPNDFFVKADGLHVVMPEEQKAYLLGARISLLKSKKGWAFDVTFPYRSEREQQLASEWLDRETMKRNTRQTEQKPKGN